MEKEAVKKKDDLEPNETPTEETTPEAEANPGAKFDDGTEEEPQAEGEETEEGAEDEPGDGQEESGEVEIVREGDTLPPASTPRGFLKRIGKLNGKVDKAQAETAGEREKREFLEEENKVLKLALEQKGAPQPQALEFPNSETFDGGPSDPDYLKAVNDYNQQQIQEGIRKGLAQVTQQTTVTTSKTEAAHSLEQSQTAHYDRAAKLGVKDYEATEDKAIEIFGLDHTNHLIANLDNSEVALYYFGKNPEIAQDFADKLKTSPIKALIQMGSHLAGVKVKKGGKSTIPDPDDELEGGSGIKPQKRGPKGATFT